MVIFIFLFIKLKQKSFGHCFYLYVYSFDERKMKERKTGNRGARKKGWKAGNDDGYFLFYYLWKLKPLLLFFIFHSFDDERKVEKERRLEIEGQGRETDERYVMKINVIFYFIIYETQTILWQLFLFFFWFYLLFFNWLV